MDEISLYRSFSARCAQLAEQASDPVTAELLRKLAADHERMAKELEDRLSRR
jgi:bacterioferritin (cytochrome b1)